MQLFLVEIDMKFLAIFIDMSITLTHDCKQNSLHSFGWQLLSMDIQVS